MCKTPPKITRRTIPKKGYGIKKFKVEKPFIHFWKQEQDHYRFQGAAILFVAQIILYVILRFLMR